MKDQITHQSSENHNSVQVKPNYRMGARYLILLESRAAENMGNNFFETRKLKMSIRFFLCILLVINLLGFAPPVMAQFTITRVTSPYFDSDSNNPGSEGPQAAYVGFEICNTSAVPLTNLSATITGITNPTIFGLAGGQDMTQILGAGGTLAPGECDVLYWYVAYNLDGIDNNSAHNRSTNITVEATDGGSNTSSGSTTIFTRSSISASAGGLITNVTVGPGVFVGQIYEYCVEYSFGNTKKDDEFNMQPAGNLDFNADCFQLVNSEITQSVIPGINVGDQDQLYYTATANVGGSDNRVTVCYISEWNAQLLQLRQLTPMHHRPVEAPILNTLRILVNWVSFWIQH